MLVKPAKSILKKRMDSSETDSPMLGQVTTSHYVLGNYYLTLKMYRSHLNQKLLLYNINSSHQVLQSQFKRLKPETYFTQDVHELKA